MLRSRLVARRDAILGGLLVLCKTEQHFSRRSAYEKRQSEKSNDDRGKLLYARELSFRTWEFIFSEKGRRTKGGEQCLSRIEDLF